MDYSTGKLAFIFIVLTIVIAGFELRDARRPAAPVT